MKHDKHYNDILRGLQGELDPMTFEACAQDLIRIHDRYFAAPIVGGDDGGMDGAIADGLGEPFPLVTTTAKDVIGNMTRNLKQYVDRGGLRRECIVATSQKLTPRRQQNLRDRATDLGFTLVQLLDRAAIAQRLYRDSKWSKELLGLTGEPSALSVLPITRRPLADHKLVGREDAETWLREVKGDKLFVGEPGAGKTSLLYLLASDERQEALFVVDRNRTAIASAIRDLQPNAIILDDAHVEIEFLETLIHLRQEIHAKFDLIATCWNGEKKTVKARFPSGNVGVLELERLTQDQMVEVIANFGITGNSVLINEIVRQAEGLPGLAGTLCSLALQGRWREIGSASALSDHIVDFYESRTESGVRGLLAAFALGGKSGMDKGVVAKELNLDRTNLQRDLANLDHGGIVAEVSYPADCITVRPAALRHALIRDMFFGGAAALPRSIFDALLENAANPIHATLALIGAYSRGADNLSHTVQDRLHSLLEGMSDLELEFLFKDFTWSNNQYLQAVSSYAWQGRAEATWVLDHLPLCPAMVAEPLLRHIPERIIPLLMKAAIGDDRELHSNPQHPIRILEDWVKRGRTVAAALHCRKSVLYAAKSWLLGGGETMVGYKVMLLSMKPEYEFLEHEPGSGRNLSFYRDCYSVEQLGKLREHWSAILECALQFPVVKWDDFLEVLREWAYPDCNSIDSTTAMREFAKQIALDLADLAANRPAIIQRLRKILRDLRVSEDLPIDSVIDTLYPLYDHDIDRKLQQESATERVKLLARQMESVAPDEVGGRLATIEEEMNGGTGAVLRGAPHLCYLLADRVEAPLKWFEAFAEAGLPSELILPFLQRAIDRDAKGWDEALRKCMASDRQGLVSGAVLAILAHPCPPANLKAAAMEAAPKYAELVSYLVFSDGLSDATLLELLRHKDNRLTSELATTMWSHGTVGQIHESLRTAWEEAILSIKDGYHDHSYWLYEILSVDQDLAVRWVERNIATQIVDPIREDRGLVLVFRALPFAERRRLLGLFPHEGGCMTMLRALVADDVELFAILLESERYEFERLAPLARKDLDKTWQRFAKLASKRSRSDESIVSATHSYGGTFWGAHSEMWAGRRDKFAAHANHDDAVIRRIALVGVKECNDHIQQYKKSEDEEAVFGRDD